MKRFLYVLAVIFLSVNLFAASQQTSSTTAATIIDRVEARLNDSDNDMWSAGDLLTWLNEGMVDIATRTLCLQGTESISLGAASTEYAITSNYVTVRAVIYNDENSTKIGLIPGTPADVGRTKEDWEAAGSKKPTYWYHWNGKIGVYPPLSSISGTTPETITVYYITRPTAIASTDNVTTPAIYDNALVFYMLGQAYIRDNQLGRANWAIQLYESEMARIRQDLNELFAAPAK